VRVRELSHGIILVLGLLLALLGQLIVELCAVGIQILQLNSHFLGLLESKLNARFQLGILRAILLIHSVLNHADLGLGLQGGTDGSGLVWHNANLIWGLFLVVLMLLSLGLLMFLLMSRCLHLLLLLYHLILVS